MDRSQRGNTLAELMATLAIPAITTGIALPNGVRTLRRAAVRSMAASIRDLLTTSRMRTQILGRAEGLRFFRRHEVWYYSIYEDRNGNGVQAADIARGIDRLVEGPIALNRPGEIAKVGLPPEGLTDPDTGQPFAPGDSPVQFNRSSMISFSPEGTSTPGSIYMSAGCDSAAVRSSDDGHIILRFYDGGSRLWQP